MLSRLFTSGQPGRPNAKYHFQLRTRDWYWAKWHLRLLRLSAIREDLVKDGANMVCRVVGRQVELDLNTLPERITGQEVKPRTTPNSQNLTNESNHCRT
jgi:hypothetical protein